MKIVKTFESFDKESRIKSIEHMLGFYFIKNYTINDDESIDVNGNVSFSRKLLSKIPFKFNRVSGDFDISTNRLTSLEGCPREVGGIFNCSQNRLENLIGGPKIVGGSYYCNDNKLTSFEGAPDRIEEEIDDEFEVFYCFGNPVCQIWDLFDGDYSKMELFNDLDIIRDDKVIILQRLNEFLDMIEQPRVDQVKGYNCI